MGGGLRDFGNGVVNFGGDVFYRAVSVVGFIIIVEILGILVHGHS